MKMVYFYYFIIFYSYHYYCLFENSEGKILKYSNQGEQKKHLKNNN